MKPVLLIGGHGITGRKVARQLRRDHPSLPIAIAGRDLAAAQAFADDLGNAAAHKVDLGGQIPNLGLPHANFSALAVFAMDDTTSGLNFAAEHGIGYLCPTGGGFEIGLQMVTGFPASQNTAVVFAGHWFAGAALLPTLELCAGFARVDKVLVGIVIDRNGSESGPSTRIDFARILGACTSMPMRTSGQYHWISGDAAKTLYKGVGGRDLEGSPSVSIDAVSIGAATGARDVAVLETWGDSFSWLEGKDASDEIVIEVTGLDHTGRAVRRRREVIASRNGNSITAIAIALLLERLAGLGHPPLATGLYTPEMVIEPAAAVAFMERAGVVIGEVAETMP